MSTAKWLATAMLCCSVVPFPRLVAAENEPAAFARRVMHIADLVLDRHYDPPARQSMMLAVTKSLATTAEQPISPGMSRRISEMTRPDEFAKLLEESWQSAIATGRAPAERLQAAALDALCNVVPGEPHIIPMRELRVEDQLAANRYVGIGIQLGLNDETKIPLIIVPFVRGPAHLAGAKANDYILEVDGKSTEGTSLEQVVQMLRGEEGTQVIIRVKQPDSDQVRTLEITRNVVPLESVLGYRRHSDNTWDFRPFASEPIGYVRFSKVVASTLHELRQAARELERQEVRGLVIDLRAVPGGHLQHFVLLADELLGDAVIGRARDARGTTTDFRSGPDSLFPRWPIVLLVNHATASAAEFLAAALQDNRRVIVVGEQTPGQCHIRQRFDLPDNLGAIVIRTGTLESADGRSLHAPENVERSRAGATSRAVHDPAQSRTIGHSGGVRPDHVVEITQQQWSTWVQWRHQQELPDPASREQFPAAADLQFDKAVEILRAAIKDKPTG